jgi:hypothetical protein
MTNESVCDSERHEWSLLPRSAFTSTCLLVDGGLEEIPIAEVFLPTHRCGVCGVTATIVIHIPERDRPPVLY